MNKIEEIKKLIELIGSQGYKDGSSTKQGWVYHPIPFEEFGPPIHKSSTIDEYNCIKGDYGSFENKRVLDIGCANGYFTFNIAMAGAESVKGYESDKFVYDVNEEIRRYKDISNVTFVNKYFEYSDVESFKDNEFDLVIMLNIHMWIRKQIGKVNTENLMKLLAKKTKVMYFQTAHTGSGGGYMVPELKSMKDVETYLKNSGFKNVVCINKNEKWFNRYMFRCSNV